MSESKSALSIAPDELAALKYVALEGGVSGEAKISCAGLGDRLGASAQTASRRLQRLEEAKMIGRDVVTDGQWVELTDDGETALRHEYTDYRQLFEGAPEVTLTGQVTSGMGEGRHYISLSGYMKQFRQRLGYEPFHGTLNVELDSESARSRGALSALEAVSIDGWEDDDRTFGPATCYPAEIAAEAGTYATAHAIVPKRTHHDTSQMEIIARDRLRDSLTLEDDEQVELRFGAAGPGIEDGPQTTGVN